MKRLLLTIIATLLLTIPALAAEDGMISLKESVVAAVKQHPQIKSLLHNRDAQANNLRASIGRFFPTLDLTSSVGFQKYSSSTTRLNGTDKRYKSAKDTTVSLTQNVFDGMNRFYEYEGSKARLKSAEFRLIDNVETVALEAVRAHMDVDRERRLVALAEDNIIAHKEVLASIVERVAGGAGSKADEMQARGRVARAETTFITYTGNLRTAEAQYFRVTGMKADALDSADYMLGDVPEEMTPILDNCLTYNPKILVAKADLEATNQDKGVSGSDFYPTVDLELSSRNTDKLDGAATYLQDNRAMLNVSWNLFNGGSDYSRLKAAKSRISESQANLQDTTDDLTRQVAAAWTEYETAYKSVEKHMEALQYSMESRDMYMMQFNVGQRSLLDVLDSINEVFSNSVLLETSQSNTNFALYKLLALQGALVKTMDVAASNYDKEAK
ncbi:TolC family outer membrane protein [Pseudodesulfovibrio sp. zrk46]|uniref:TolC family outer membrane protein n=1 Tax=Pseudodesulfovibrio sp. zrk46 TaxID=2725288 RepID=UPI001449F13E|nr:TolC family outer membrane protein [Pseudodesulfovibrio sp. zrk46]QJB57169.1 TolC family outer membrane protein [Pseudodesulfovibrio sp. zrk46]